jgi:hypothetical protein
LDSPRFLEAEIESGAAGLWGGSIGQLSAGWA